MANARKPQRLTEILATTGTVTPNSTHIKKRLVMTGNVTLNPPADTYPDDDYEFEITRGGFALTLDAAYVSKATTPPVLAENVIMQVRVIDDGTMIYWVDLNEA